MNTNRNTIYILSKGKIIFLFSFFIFLFLLGLVGSSLTLTSEKNFMSEYSISSLALIGGFSTALVGNTIFYIRKLYKLCISNNMKQNNDSSDNISEIGIFMYLISRPFFAIGFSLLIHIVLKSSISFVSINEVSLNNNFIYLITLLSFLSGFATGDFLTFLEEKSKKVINEKINI